MVVEVPHNHHPWYEGRHSAGLNLQDTSHPHQVCQ